jgi:hypothetical protein
MKTILSVLLFLYAGVALGQANPVAFYSANTSPYLNPQTAPQWYLQSLSAGPSFLYFDDFLAGAAFGTSPVGSPSGATACSGTAFAGDQNHQGIIGVATGTTSGAGEGCVTVGGLNSLYDLNLAPGWLYETLVQVSALPGTTAAQYQAGLSHSYGNSPYTGVNVNFLLSSVETNENHWYCAVGTTYTDSGVTATAGAWTRLDIVSNGTTVNFYINGTVASACSTAASNLNSAGMSPTFNALGETTTSVNMLADYWMFQRTVTR